MKEYTKKDFRHLCVTMGYGSSALVTEYYKQNPKPFYTDDDFIEVYRLNATYAGIKRTTKRKT